MKACAAKDKVVGSWSAVTLGIVWPQPSVRAFDLTRVSVGSSAFVQACGRPRQRDC